jgi:hypothetical protein
LGGKPCHRFDLMILYSFNSVKRTKNRPFDRLFESKLLLPMKAFHLLVALAYLGRRRLLEPLGLQEFLELVALLEHLRQPLERLLQEQLHQQLVCRRLRIIP